MKHYTLSHETKCTEKHTHTHTHGEREGERERLSMDPNYTLSTHTSTRYHSYLK